jgi:alpha-tubulin suppressor-like RCC1 family protein
MKIKKDRISFIVLISLVFLMFLVSGVKIISFIEQLEEGAFLKAELSLVPLTSGEVSGYIYYDKDGDNEMEGDMMVNNAQVELYELVDGQYEIITNTTSNHQGFYEFSSLPEGIYFVKVNPKNLDIEQKPRRSDVNNLLTETPYLPVDGSGSLDIALYSLNVDKQGVFGDNLSVALGDLSKITDATYWDKLTENINAKYLDLNYDGIVNLKDLVKILDSDYWEFPNYDLDKCTSENDCVLKAEGLFVSGYNSCAISRNQLICWGNNYSKTELGYFSIDHYNSPLEHALFDSVQQIDFGYKNTYSFATHVCALQNDTTVKCWGRGNYGQLGNNNNQDSAIPVEVQDLNLVKELSLGTNATCALLYDGSVKCWGWNDWGRLGHGQSVQQEYIPVAVVGVDSAINISSSFGHTCVTLEDGTVKCWGYGGFGQLGDGKIRTTQRTAVQVLNIDSATQVSVGMGHSCAVLSDGTVKCWGRNNFGQLGNNSETNSSIPVTVLDINNAIQVSLGDYHTCALLDDGSIKCWGNNSNGRLGNNSSTDTSIPVAVHDINEAVKVDLGNNHSCALLENQTIKCWGKNDRGQLGTGQSFSSHVPANVVGDYNCNLGECQLEIPICQIDCCNVDTDCQEDDFCGDYYCDSEYGSCSKIPINQGLLCAQPLSTCTLKGCNFDPITAGLCNEHYINTGTITAIIVMDSARQLSDNEEVLGFSGKYLRDNELICGGYKDFRPDLNAGYPLFGNDSMSPTKDGFSAGEIINHYIRTTNYVCKVQPVYDTSTPGYGNNGKWAPLALFKIVEYRDLSGAVDIDFQNAENCTYLGPMT